jgi:acyl carrier protein
MDSDETRLHVRRAVHEHADLLEDLDRLTDSCNLFDAGFSSLGAVRVLIALEQEFSIVFPDKLMSRETFSSIRSIADAVERTLTVSTAGERTDQ